MNAIRRGGSVGWLLLLGLACGQASQQEAPTGYAECSTSDDCLQGECLCGVCTFGCNESDECGAMGPSSQCYREGSFGHQLVCSRQSSGGGLCLSGCAGDLSCGKGLSCRDGLCLPEQLMLSTPVVAAPAFSQELAPMPSAQEMESLPGAVTPVEMAVVQTECVATLGGLRPYACECPEESFLCPSLEQAVARESCSEIWLGCGLLSVRNASTFTASRLHYDAQTGEPVGYEFYGDVIGGERVALDRPVQCSTTQFVCATCGVDRPLCADTDGWFPPELEPQP